MCGNRRRDRRIEHHRAHAKRRADDGEQLVRVGAAPDRTVGNGQGRAGGDAAGEVQQDQGAETGDLRGSAEGQGGAGIAGDDAEAARQAVEHRRRHQAGADRAKQESGHGHAGVLEVETVVLDQGADPDWQCDQVDHAGEVTEHEDGAAAPAIRRAARI
jgi:hypothetical protein